MTVGSSYSPGEVADRLAIQDVMARYVHALDERDYDRLDGVCQDGAIHHVETVGVYEDAWTKTMDGWRISERTWIHGWIWGDSPSAQLPGQF